MHARPIGIQIVAIIIIIITINEIKTNIFDIISGAVDAYPVVSFLLALESSH